MDKPLYVFAKFKAKKDKIAQVKEILRNFIKDTLSNEEGCVAYNYLQSSEDETVFTSMEVWQNADAESAHWNTPHIKKLIEDLPPLVEGTPEITKYNRI